MQTNSTGFLGNHETIMADCVLRIAYGTHSGHV